MKAQGYRRSSNACWLNKHKSRRMENISKKEEKTLLRHEVDVDSYAVIERMTVNWQRGVGVAHKQPHTHPSQ